MKKRRLTTSSRRPTSVRLLIALAALFSSVDISRAFSTSPIKLGEMAPELSPQRIQEVTQLVARALGDDDGDVEQGGFSNNQYERYASARTMASEFDPKNNSTPPPVAQHELVYGELSVPVLATLLDAVGVYRGDCFLDIGSGDGALVMGAALLFPEFLQSSRGLEIVPGLVQRSQEHARRLRRQVQNVDFVLGNVYETENDAVISSLLRDTTLAVCFATTWSAGNVFGEKKKKTSLKRRALPKLSQSLTRLPPMARIVMVDGTLSEKDGYEWQGDLKITCPDTAPYSIASLYQRI